MDIYNGKFSGNIYIYMWIYLVYHGDRVKTCEYNRNKMGE